MVLNFKGRGQTDRKCEECQNTWKSERTPEEFNTHLRRKNRGLGWDVEAGKWLRWETDIGSIQTPALERMLKDRDNFK